MKKACDSYHLTVFLKASAAAFLWPEKVGFSIISLRNLTTYLNEKTRSKVGLHVNLGTIRKV